MDSTTTDADGTSDTGSVDAPDIVDDGVSDVLAIEEQVSVPTSVVEQAKSLDYDGATFIEDIQDWDEPDDGGEPASSTSTPD